MYIKEIFDDKYKEFEKREERLAAQKKHYLINLLKVLINAGPLIPGRPQNDFLEHLEKNAQIYIWDFAEILQKKAYFKIEKPEFNRASDLSLSFFLGHILATIDGLDEAAISKLLNHILGNSNHLFSNYFSHLQHFLPKDEPEEEM